MELTELLNEKEWRRCRGSEGATDSQLEEAFTYFYLTYWFIKHPERGRIRPDDREAQREIISKWISERKTISLKARQIGFSTLAAAFAFWETFFWADRFEFMLSRTEREAMKLLAKAKYGYRFLPKWMKQRGPQLLSKNKLEMPWSNESAIESLPSGSDPARGETAYRVFVDEMAFIPNQEEAWASIEPIADVGGRINILSTAKGEGNTFHVIWVGSQTGAGTGSDFVGIFFPWSANTERDQAWYDAKALTIPAWQMAQEYPRNAEEAFLRSGRPVFSLDALRALTLIEPARGYLKKELGRNVYTFIADGGELAIWEFPAMGMTYSIGADVAEGLGHGDYSSAHVICANTGKVVAHWHGHTDADVFGHDTLFALGHYYNLCLDGVESNNHGLTTLKALQRAGYENIFRQRKMNHVNATASESLGWRTTTVSKPVAIDELNAAIRDGTLMLHDEKTVAELKTFVREANGKTHGSPHDDRVMSLAIAVQMLKYVWLDEFRPNRTPKKNTLEWWDKQLDELEKVFEKPIGAGNARR